MNAQVKNLHKVRKTAMGLIESGVIHRTEGWVFADKNDAFKLQQAGVEFDTTPRTASIHKDSLIEQLGDTVGNEDDLYGLIDKHSSQERFWAH